MHGFYTSTVLDGAKQSFKCQPSAWDQASAANSKKMLCKADIDLPWPAVIHSTWTAHCQIHGSNAGTSTISLDNDANDYADWDGKEKYEGIPAFYSQDGHGSHWSACGLNRIMRADAGKHTIAVWVHGNHNWNINGMAMTGFFFPELEV